MKKHLSCLFAAVALLAVSVGCSSNSNNFDDTPVVVRTTGVTLNKTYLELKKDATEVITATVLPENATNKNVIWDAQPQGIVFVNDGNVVALNSGTAAIIAYPEDGGTPASCTVKVTVDVDSVTVSPNVVMIDAGQRTTITANVLPIGAGERGVSFISDNPNVASVEQPTPGGMIAYVTGNSPNQSTNIRVVSEDNPEKVALCFVIVNSGVTTPVTSVELNMNEMRLAGGETGLLTATVLPDNATNKSVTWETLDNNERIASVVDGRVTAGTDGTATIRCYSDYDRRIYADCVVTVDSNIPVTGISIDKNNLSMVVGYTETLAGTVTPANAKDKGIAWSVTDGEGVVEVTPDGLVTALSSGEAEITATTNDGGFTASCRVTVRNVYVAGREINNSNVAVYWENGTRRTPTVSGSGNAEATSVFVNSRAVFVAGYEVNAAGNSVARVWEDRMPMNLSVNATRKSAANSVYVSSSNYVFAAGYETLSATSDIKVARFWKDGAMQPPLTNGGGNAEATSIFVVDNTEYVVGYDTNIQGVSVGMLWKNGVFNNLDSEYFGDRSARATSVYVWNNKAFIAGWENDQDGKPVAMLWEENGNAFPGKPLTSGTPGNGMANSVFVSPNGDVYVAGYETNALGVAVATVWKNGNPARLSLGGTDSVANSVYVVGSDVYVVGYEQVNGKPEARIWKDGYSRPVSTTTGTNGSIASSVVVY